MRFKDRFSYGHRAADWPHVARIPLSRWHGFRMPFCEAELPDVVVPEECPKCRAALPEQFVASLERQLPGSDRNRNIADSGNVRSASARAGLAGIALPRARPGRPRRCDPSYYQKAFSEGQPPAPETPMTQIDYRSHGCKQSEPQRWYRQRRLSRVKYRAMILPQAWTVEGLARRRRD